MMRRFARRLLVFVILVLLSTFYFLPAQEDPASEKFQSFAKPTTYQRTTTLLNIGNYSYVALLKFNAFFAGYMHRNFYNVAGSSLAPVVLASAYEGNIVLDWGSDLETLAQIEEDDWGNGYFLEGYKIWQLPDEDASLEEAVRITTFDKPTPPSGVPGDRYDPESGLIIRVPVAYGRNSGIRRYLVIDKDYFSNKPLIDGKEYTFAVTAYRYNPDPGNPLPVIESSPGKITVRAQTTNPGYQARPGDTLKVTHTGNSTGKVTAVVINPGLLTGHDYRVEFNEEKQYVIEPILDDSGAVIYYDTLGIWHTWNLVDATTGTVLLEDQSNISGEGYYPIVDGIRVIVYSPELSGLTSCEFIGNYWISGVDWGGGPSVCPGLSLGNGWWPPYPPSEYVSVNLVFQGDTTGGPVDGWASKGAVYWRDQGYAYAGTGYLPFSAYDISDPDNPRQMNICFVEDSSYGNHNLRWDMGGWDPVNQQFTSTLGGREYFFIMNSDYNEGADYNDENWAPDSDVLYYYWPQPHESHPYLESPFEMIIHYDRVSTSEDIFTFTAPGPASVPDRFRLFQNYPNPFNATTTIRYWIPRRTRVKLEIFNTLGQRVTSLVNQTRDQGEYFVHWQPENIASGLYIYRMDAGGTSEVRKMLLVK